MGNGTESVDAGKGTSEADDSVRKEIFVLGFGLVLLWGPMESSCSSS